MDIEKYEERRRGMWDGWIAKSRNGTFLFFRSYMEYHADRFTDYSLMIFEQDQLIAVLPASLHGSEVRSHGGLTFGGFIVDERMNASRMMSIMKFLVLYFQKNKIQKLIYKSVPHIYHRYPCEEDLYALYRCGAQLARRDLSSTIDLNSPLKFSKSKKQGATRAIKGGLVINESKDFDSFFGMLNLILKEKYRTTATHTAEEMRLLASKLPNHIRLFGAYLGEQMLAGAIVYEDTMVAHTQYLATSEKGRELGALDLVIQNAINYYKGHQRYFDFGISTEKNGLYLNSGLIGQKELFGARGVAYDFYELRLDKVTSVEGWI